MDEPSKKTGADWEVGELLPNTPKPRKVAEIQGPWRAKSQLHLCATEIWQTNSQKRVCDNEELPFAKKIYHSSPQFLKVKDSNSVFSFKQEHKTKLLNVDEQVRTPEFSY